jgi:hypothetical protein
MAQDEAYDVRVVGRRTDDQGRTLIQETFWYKGSFYMTDRYERADESSEEKAVEDAIPAPPNPTEDGPVEATPPVEVPTLPVETRPAGCNLVETAITAQPATTQKAGASPNANYTRGQTAKQTQQPDGPKADSSHRKPSAPAGRGHRLSGRWRWKEITCCTSGQPEGRPEEVSLRWRPPEAQPTVKAT